MFRKISSSLYSGDAVVKTSVAETSLTYYTLTKHCSRRCHWSATLPAIVHVFT